MSKYHGGELLSDEFKLAILGMFWPQLLDGLAAGLPKGVKTLTADDPLDFLAMGIAGIIDQDGHLTTPRERRLAIETASKRVEHWLRSFRSLHEREGRPALHFLVEQGEKRLADGGTEITTFQ